MKDNTYYFFLFGLSWYLLFILPGLPLLMRWYCFISSFGILIMFSTVFFNFFPERKRTIIFKNISICILLLFFSFKSFSLGFDWIKSSEIQANILKKISQLDLSHYKSITIWCLPEKYNGINCFKVGIEQAVQYSSNNKNVRVFTPLKTEITSQTSTGIISFIDSGKVQLTTDNIRFFQEELNRRTRVKYEIFNKSTEYYDIKIVNSTVSSCYLALKTQNPDNLNLFCNGNDIIPMKY